MTTRQNRHRRKGPHRSSFSEQSVYTLLTMIQQALVAHNKPEQGSERLTHEC